jgi:hypothetical protein
MLKEPLPEVFLINMNYSGAMGNAHDIMTLLLAIPESFDPCLLYNAAMQKKFPKSLYILRAMVCYSGCHYVTYRRNTKTKLDYVLDPQNPNKSF